MKIRRCCIYSVFTNFPSTGQVQFTATRGTCKDHRYILLEYTTNWNKVRGYYIPGLTWWKYANPI